MRQPAAKAGEELEAAGCGRRQLKVEGPREPARAHSPMAKTKPL